MKFFCPKCQKKQQADLIVPDLMSICKQEIKNRLDRLIEKGELTSQEVEGLNSLSRTTEHLSSHRFLAYSRKDLKLKLTDQVEQDGDISGTLTFTLGTLHQEFNSFLSSEKNREGKDREVQAWEKEANVIPWESLEKLKNQVIFQRRMTFHYAQQKNADHQVEYVFLSCQTNGDYYKEPDSGVMLGFRRVCACCGTILHQCTGLAPEVVVVLAGSPRAGKTSCVTAVVSALSSQSAARNGLSLIHHANDEPVQWLFSETENFYEKGYKVTKTPTAQTSAGAYSIHLCLGQKNAGKANTSRECILTFVDMPGEFWQDNQGEGLSDDFFKQYQGIFLNANCIWLLMSKVTVMNISLEQNPELAKMTAEDANTVKNAQPVQLQRNFGSLVSQVYHNQSVPPIAMILTKSDVNVTTQEQELNLRKMYNLFPESQLEAAIEQKNHEDTEALFIKRNSSLPAVNMRRLFDQGNEVRSFFEDHALAYENAICSCFEDRYYSAMSAYGHQALNRDNQSIDPPTPFHELHPLIWTLAAFGMLEVKHEMQVLAAGLMAQFTRKMDRRSDYFLFDARDKSSAGQCHSDIEATLFFHGNSYRETIQVKR